MKVGDQVRIKSWETMAKEFNHVEGCDYIAIECDADGDASMCFVGNMRDLCGRLCTITRRHGSRVWLSGVPRDFEYCLGMLEPAHAVSTAEVRAKFSRPVFKAGDRVRIRKWEDIQDDCLVPDIKQFCGEETVITSVSSQGLIQLYAHPLYEFTADMLEHVEPNCLPSRTFTPAPTRDWEGVVYGLLPIEEKHKLIDAKEIQIFASGHWKPTCKSLFDPNVAYRVAPPAPTPKLVPWERKDVKLGMQVRRKERGSEHLIVSVTDKGVYAGQNWCYWLDLLRDYEQLDGKPCGKEQV